MNGSVRQLANAKDGRPRWELRVYAGIDPLTRRPRQKTRTVTGSRREADKAMRALVAEVEAGRHRRTAGTLDTLLEAWLAHKGPDWSPTTRARTEQIIRTHLSPALGDVQLSKLKAWKIDELYGKLRASGLAPASVRKVHSVLHAALRQGVRWEWITANPADTDVASPPKVPKAQVTVPSVEQVQRLMAAAERTSQDIACFVRLAATTGARRGELCGIRWSDVVMSPGDGGVTASLRLVRAVVDVEGVITVRQVKTHQSERRVELDPVTVLDVLDQIERTRARAAAAEVALVEDPYLFNSVVTRPTRPGRRWQMRVDGGAPWSPRSPTAVWRTVRAEVGLPAVKMRTLRHFTATQLLGAGVDIKTVQRRLGHAQAAMTLDIYGSFMPGTDGVAAAHMADLLRLRETTENPTDTP